jgi:hypothetical protein
LGGKLSDLVPLGLGVGFALEKTLYQDSAAKHLTPAANHFLIGPSAGTLFVHPQNHVLVVVHDRISTDINGKHSGKRNELVHDPLIAVLKALARELVLPA